MAHSLLEKLHKLSLAQELPSHDYLFDLADRCSTVLENERTAYRPESDSHETGGLLDFVTDSDASKPVLIIPDLHARTYFLYHILNYPLPKDFVSPVNGKKLSVYEALSENLLCVVSVGDLLHSEMRGKERWLNAFREFKTGVAAGNAMSEEMKEELSLLCMVMELKCAFPAVFHVLKGNHENIMNEESEGNFPFKKFAEEGEMTFMFMQEEYGDDVLMVISSFEKNLPLVAAFPNCLISHAEPAEAYSKKRLVNGMKDASLVKGLTWTKNDEVQINTCEPMLKKLTVVPHALYFGGHRPVAGECAFRQNGKYVQIHNPEREQIVLVYKERSFNSDTDIIDVAENAH